MSTMDLTEIWLKAYLASITGAANNDSIGSNFDAIVRYAAGIADATVRELKRRERDAKENSGVPNLASD